VRLQYVLSVWCQGGVRQQGLQEVPAFAVVFQQRQAFSPTAVVVTEIDGIEPISRIVTVSVCCFVLLFRPVELRAEMR